MNYKILLQNSFLVLGSLIFMAILSELLLRVMLPSPIVWKYPQETYLFDPEIGHRLEPNQQSFTHDKMVNINSQGIRDAEYTRKPAKHVTRILALGDSQTFGNGIAIEDTWPKQLEHELRVQGETDIYEVLNAGLPATDTWQHEILLQRLMSTYNPEVVVLAFYVNDIVARPESIINTQGDDTRTLSRRLIYLVKRSALLLSLRTAYDVFKQMITPRRDFLLQSSILAGESNPVIDKRWEQVWRSLSTMKEVTARNNIDFLVVSLPRRDQIDGRLPAENYNGRLSAMIERAKVRFMNLLGPLQEAYKVYGKALFIPWDGHNTALANRVIAREVTAAIPGMLAGGPEQSRSQSSELISK